MSLIVLFGIAGALAVGLAGYLWGIGTLTWSDSVTFGWNAQNTQTGSDYQPNVNATNIVKKLPQAGTAVANNVAGGGNQLYSVITSIAGAGNASIDLTSITNILGTSGVSLARVKGIKIRLLDASDDPVVVSGTPASSITIDGTVANSLSGQSHAGWFDNAAGSNFALQAGDFLSWGTKSAAGVLVDGTHKVIKVVNNDGTNTAKVQITIFGGDS